MFETTNQYQYLAQNRGLPRLAQAEHFHQDRRSHRHKSGHKALGFPTERDA